MQIHPALALAAVALLFFAPPSGARGPGGHTGTIVCSAPPNSSSRCDVPTDGRVSLVRTLGGRCVEGQTWGYDGTGIWVAAGCAGEFAFGQGAAAAGNRPGGGWGGWQGDGYAGEISCRSDRGRERFCAADVRGRATLLRQTSSAPCIEGESWRAEADGIRVRNGCAGRFAYGFGGRQPR
jgi:hypothetical protein